jgi:lipopolysaccharide export system protein LptC
MLAERNILVYLFLMLLAIVSWWMVKLTEPKQAIEEVVAQHSVDYYSFGYQKRNMNDLGELSSEVKAEKMEHYSDDGSVHLKAPVLSFFEINSPPWIITAERGILTNAGKDLFLSGNVLASRAASQGNRAVSIKTSDLQVKPETSYAETAKLAELRSPPDITTGVGMQLSFADPIRITLLNQVRGRYELH